MGRGMGRGRAAARVRSLALALALAPAFAFALAACPAPEPAPESGLRPPPDRASEPAPAPRPAPAPPAAGARGPALYDRLGGIAGVTALVDAALVRLVEDPRLAARFEGANMVRVRRTFIELVASAAGGPEVYTGLDMKKSHMGMGITDAEQDAFIDDVDQAAQARGVGEAERAELRAFLESTREAIVDRRTPVERRLDRAVALLERVDKRLAAIEGQLAAGGAMASKPGGAGAGPAAAAPAALVKPVPRWSPDERRFALSTLVARYTAKRLGGAPPAGAPLLGRALEPTRFLSSAGDTVELKDLRQKKLCVLVILRGFAGAVCIHCSSQTLALAHEYRRFVEAGAEVFLVYPGKAHWIPQFLDAVQNLEAGFAPPFPVLLDVDLALTQDLGIEASLAQPTSLVLDLGGVIRYAYVGQQPADRPSAEDLLDAVLRVKSGR